MEKRLGVMLKKYMYPWYAKRMTRRIRSGLGIFHFRAIHKQKQRTKGERTRRYIHSLQRPRKKAQIELEEIINI